jgi:predicted hydrolase (HD superfamily)
MKEHGFVNAPSGIRALTEEQLVAFTRDQMLKAVRQRLKDNGFAPDVARQKVRRWKLEGLSAEEIVDRARHAYPQRNSQE